MSKKWLTTAALAAGLVAIPGAASADTQWRLFGGFSDPSDLEDGHQLGDVYDYNYSIDGIDTESGFVVGAAFGVNTGNWTAEVEVAHREVGLSDDDVTVSFTGYYGGAYSYTGAVDGDLTVNSLMANAWYNFPTASNFGFYVGGGAGIADIEADTAIDFTYYYADGTADESGTNFAWQLGAGVNLKTESGFSYGIGYRYFNVDNLGDSGFDLQTHEVVFEFRF